VPRSAVGVGLVVGLLVGGLTGLALDIYLEPAGPGRSWPVLGSFFGSFGLVAGAVAGAVVDLANRLLGRRPVRPDTPEADYREPDPPKR
jgi:hypothetical protein